MQRVFSSVVPNSYFSLLERHSNRKICLLGFASFLESEIPFMKLNHEISRRGTRCYLVLVNSRGAAGGASITVRQRE